MEGLAKKRTSGFCVSSFLAKNDSNGDFCIALSLEEFEGVFAHVLAHK